MRRLPMLTLAAFFGITSLMGQSDPNQPQSQSQSDASSASMNPQSPTTPMGSTPSQSSPASGQNAQQPPNQSPAQATNNSNSAEPPANTNVQQVQPAATGADEVPANTEMRAALDTPLSSKVSKPGDRFTATITDPVRGSNGAVIIPPGARVEGEVADLEQSKAVSALRDKPQLSLRFRDIVLPNGQTLPLSATLVSVNSTKGRNTEKADEESHVQAGTQGKDVAQNVGTGNGMAASGPLNFGAPLKGLAVGTLAGGGYILPTKGKQVSLPAQTGMVIKLDQPISGTSPSM
ncbi:MAG TPA: hypothetical protein VJV96_01530 [Candidatus Angelobacter sp.]|nr:hypothetical protein [Candidatus Angelobacter sp.]